MDIREIIAIYSHDFDSPGLISRTTALVPLDEPESDSRVVKVVVGWRRMLQQCSTKPSTPNPTSLSLTMRVCVYRMKCNPQP